MRTVYDDFVQECRDAAKAHPELLNQIQETLSLADAEITDGGDMVHEVELGRRDLNELIERRG